MAGNLNFKLRIVFWNIFFWRFEKRITLSKKKPPLCSQLKNLRQHVDPPSHGSSRHLAVQEKCRQKKQRKRLKRYSGEEYELNAL